MSSALYVLHGKGLRGRIPLAGHASLGNGTFLDAEDGLARVAVEDEHPSGLADDLDRGNLLTVDLEVEQAWSRRQIGIPQVVMNRLEIPFELARGCVHGDDGICEKVRARPVSAVVVRGRSADGHVDRVGLFVRGHVPAPDVCAGAAVPTIVEPGFVTDFTRTRDGVKSPEELAGDRVVGARVARRSLGQLADAGAEQGDVLKDCGDAAVADGQLGDSASREGGHEFSGGGVERDQFAVERGEDNTRRVRAVSEPVRNASRRGLAGRQFVVPDFLAGLGINCQHFVSGGKVHDSVDGDGRDFQAAAFDQFHGPGLRQLRDVLRIDLLERGITRTRGIVTIHRPVAGALLRLGCRSERRGKKRGETSNSSHPQNTIGAHQSNPPLQVAVNIISNYYGTREFLCGLRGPMAIGGAGTQARAARNLQISRRKFRAADFPPRGCESRCQPRTP
jgi:hypothetical protein